MTNVIVTLKIMPESVEVDLENLKNKLLDIIKEFAGEGDTKTEEEPIAFGLKALKILFIMDESLGSTETLEESIKAVEGIQSVEVTDVRRAIG
jgi:elongation factor 1-beta